MDTVPDRARDSNSHTTRTKYERNFVYDVETTSSKTSSGPKEKSPRPSSGDERNLPRSSTKAATSQKSPAAIKKDTPKRKQSPDPALKQDTPKRRESSKDTSKKRELSNSKPSTSPRAEEAPKTDGKLSSYKVPKIQKGQKARYTREDLLTRGHDLKNYEEKEGLFSKKDPKR